MTIPFKSVPLRVLRTLLLLVFVVGSFGCADGEFRFGDPFDREVTLSESQHRYTVLIRWNEFQKARSFVHNDDIGEFLAQTKMLKHARFTDYESEPVELDDEKETATIRVTYTLYTPTVPYELQIAEIQEWHRDGLSNDWRVRSTFEGLQQIASN